ncbi:MAG: hypothetical protein ACOCQQ_02810 [Candidatus Nanoarchaeia archaeon]
MSNEQEMNNKLKGDDNLMRRQRPQFITYPKKIMQRSIIINDSGYFFDYLFNKTNLKKITDATFEADEIEIIAYPTYDQILENIEPLKKSCAVVLLYEFQRKEQEILCTYFRKQKMDVNDQFLLDFLKLDLDLNELQKSAEKNYYHRILYVFLQTRKEVNLNPSNLNNINTKNFNYAFSRADFEGQEIKYSLAKKYVELSNEFDLVSFFSLLYFELTGFEDEYIAVLVKLMKHNKDPNKFDATDILCEKELNKEKNNSPIHNYEGNWWTVCHPYN